MAYGGRGKKAPVLLGYMDEYMDSDQADAFTSKIGGAPDWHCGSVPPPSCPLCGSAQPQICQIYAPLDNSVYHRTLHIVCCVQPACWNRNKSWACYRSQLKDTTAASAAAIVATSVAASSTDWLEDADDWGEEEEDNGNQNLSNTTDTSPDSPPPQGAVGGMRTTGPPLDNLNQKIPFHKLNLGEDPNANGCGATKAPETQFDASAEIEVDDEDAGCVSVDMPEVDTSHIPALFHTGNSADVPTSGVVIMPRYIWVGEETEESSQMSQHEQNLVKQVNKDLEGGKGGEDVYEKVLPRHGDEYSHKFISTIQRNPGQILRYGRNSSEPPLLFQPLELLVGNQSINQIIDISRNQTVVNQTNNSSTAQDLLPSKCTYCGGKLVFEMQLLPTLVSCVETRDIPGTVVEFGTVLVYTCAESCWKEGDTIRQEVIFLQQENM